MAWAGVRRERLVHKKLSRLVEPNLQPYFFCLALFTAIAVPIQPMLAAAEAAVLVLLYMFYRYQSVRRRRSVVQYIETITGGVDSISKNSLLNTPLPVVVFRLDNGEVIWANDSFMGLTEAKEGVFDLGIKDMAPGFDYQNLLADGAIGELVEMNGCTYQVYGSVSRMSGRSASQGQIITAYFVDVTESQHLKAVYEATRPVVSVLVLDNYEELMKAGGEAARSAVLAQIDERINTWVTGSGGMLRKYDRDRYFFICDEQSFTRLVEEKFSVLDSMVEPGTFEPKRRVTPSSGCTRITTALAPSAAAWLLSKGWCGAGLKTNAISVTRRPRRLPVRR